MSYQLTNVRKNEEKLKKKKSLGELSQRSTGKTETQIVELAGQNANF